MGIKDLEDLLFVGFCVGKHLFFGEGRAGFRPARRVAYAARKVTDQKNDMVPQLLKMAHLVHHNRVPKVQVGSGGVKAHLYAQRCAAFKLFAQFFFVNQLGNAALDGGHLAVNIRHHPYLCAGFGKKRRTKKEYAPT